MTKINSVYAVKFDPKQIRRGTVRRLIVLGSLSVAVFFVVFFGGILLFPATTHLRDASGAVNWSLLEGFMSLLTVALIFGGSFFALIEYINGEIQEKREGAEASFNIYREIFDRLMSLEDTEARRWIIQNIPMLEDGQDQETWIQAVRAKIHERPQGWDEPVPPGQMHLKRILNTLDFVGFVAENYWDMENELVEWMSSPITKVWERVGPYIDDEADKRGEPDFYNAARELGWYCLQWRREHYGVSNIIPGAT